MRGGNHTHKVDAAGSNCLGTIKSTSSTTSTSTLLKEHRDQLVLSGDYDEVVGTEKETFLLECTAVMSSLGSLDVECYDVISGSIIVFVRGSRPSLDAALLEVHTNGLKLPSFGTLVVRSPSSAVTTPELIVGTTSSVNTENFNSGNKNINSDKESSESSTYILVITIILVVIAVVVVLVLLYVRRQHASFNRVNPKEQESNSVFGDVEMGSRSSKAQKKGSIGEVTSDADPFETTADLFPEDKMPSNGSPALRPLGATPEPFDSREDTVSELSPMLGSGESHAASNDSRHAPGKKQNKSSTRKKKKRRKQKKRHKSGHMSIDEASDVLTDASEVLTDHMDD